LTIKIVQIKLIAIFKWIKYVGCSKYNKLKFLQSYDPTLLSHIFTHIRAKRRIL